MLTFKGFYDGCKLRDMDKFALSPFTDDVKFTFTNSAEVVGMTKISIFLRNQLLFDFIYRKEGGVNVFIINTITSQPDYFASLSLPVYKDDDPFVETMLDIIHESGSYCRDDKVIMKSLFHYIEHEFKFNPDAGDIEEW